MVKIIGATEKLQSIIDEGRAKVSSALSSIQEEIEQRKDIIVKPSAIDYRVDVAGVRPMIGDDEYTLTNHAKDQLYGKTNIPSVYAEKLLELKEYDLLRVNLKSMTERLNGGGILMRRIDNTIKGWLSPSYRRMDAAPVFENFVKASLANGYQPYLAHNSEYRYQLQFVYPEIFQPAPNEYVVYGVSITTGDYGGQALQLEMMALRIVCKNLAVGYNLLRKVHLGKRFDIGDSEVFELSQKTHALDSKTVASAVSDVVVQSKKHIELVNETVKESISKEIDIDKAVIGLRKKGMSKEMADKVKTTYETTLPIEVLPQQSGAWRLSNVISLLAQHEEADKTIDMEKLAMEVLTAA